MANILTGILIGIGRILVNGWHLRKYDIHTAKHLEQALNFALEQNKIYLQQITFLQDIITSYQRISKAK